MRIACVTMQRNEDQCLEPWLRYHGYFFGFENLFVLDHNSTSVQVQKILARYAACGVHVHYLGPDADYKQKGLFVANEIKAAEERQPYDFLFPIDCDEFLCARRCDGALTVSRNYLLDTLKSCLDTPGIFQITENLMNQPTFPGYFVPAAYQKVFFSSGECEMLDHGSHTGISKTSKKIIATPFIYAHFHFRSYEVTKQGAKEKLLPWIDPDDRLALSSFNGPGHHLKQYFLEPRDAYYKNFQNQPPAVYFEELVNLFDALGLDQNFVMTDLSLVDTSSAPDGWIDVISPNKITGWAWDAAHPEERLSIAVEIDGTVIGTVIADQFRGDLAGCGKGDGRHAFTMEMNTAQLVTAGGRVRCCAMGVNRPPFILHGNGELS